MNRCGLRRYPYPTSREAKALMRPGKGGEKVQEALRQRQLQQMKEQLPRLDAMIARAKAERPKDVRRFQTWKRQLIRHLRKEGIDVPNATVFEVTADHRKKVVEYIQSRPEGKRGPWGEFAKAVGVSGTNLGIVVRAMLQDGTISEPAGKGSMVYVVVPAKGRAKAKRLYQQQRQSAEGSPKGRAPVSLEGRSEAKAPKAA